MFYLQKRQKMKGNIDPIKLKALRVHIAAWLKKNL
jgi:hypothetical protein